MVNEQFTQGAKKSFKTPGGVFISLIKKETGRELWANPIKEHKKHCKDSKKIVSNLDSMQLNANAVKPKAQQQEEEKLNQ